APAHGYAPDAAPRTATAAVEAAANGLARPATTIPTIGGVYPNINEAPGTSGVALMTPEERAAMEAQLRGLSSAHAAAATSGSAARRAEIEAALRDLAATLASRRPLARARPRRQTDISRCQSPRTGSNRHIFDPFSASSSAKLAGRPFRAYSDR
ncbi:MAG TPA: hypothetical protein PLG99_07445, partial [Kaistiaceae bacterium]|nr:hypothetical protein [Kaistiaceae bacterium]